MGALHHKRHRWNKVIIIGFMAMAVSFVSVFAMDTDHLINAKQAGHQAPAVSQTEIFAVYEPDYSLTAACQYYEQQGAQPEVIMLQAELDQRLEQEREAKAQREEAEKHKPKLVSLGEYKITFYCSCAKCCGKNDGITATGTVATEGKTIAVDPRVITLGSKVIIDGKQYIAEDTGGFKGQTIDMFVDSHQEALSRGVIRREVFLESK